MWQLHVLLWLIKLVRKSYFYIKLGINKWNEFQADLNKFLKTEHMPIGYLCFRTEQKTITGPQRRMKIWENKKTFLESLADSYLLWSTEAESFSFFLVVDLCTASPISLMTSINQNQIYNKIYSRLTYILTEKIMWEKNQRKCFNREVLSRFLQA